MIEEITEQDPALVDEVNEVFTDRSLSRAESEARVKSLFGIERVIRKGEDPDLAT
jgi:hypothetical protein